MSTTMFDPQIAIDGTTVLKGEFTKVKVSQSPAFPGDVNNLVIDPSKPFTIDLEWKLGGVLGNVNSQLNDIGDKSWIVQVYAEKMGPGSDLQIYNKTLPNSIKTVDVLPATWTHTCEIPANQLEEHVPGDPTKSGMYRLCIVVFANTEIAGCHDIIGCHEGPMILAENLN
jgi:hypothetical protein